MNFPGRIVRHLGRIRIACCICAIIVAAAGETALNSATAQTKGYYQEPWTNGSYQEEPWTKAKSLGIGTSYFNATLDYSVWANPEKTCFHRFSIGVDLDEAFKDKVIIPGVSASYSYNFSWPVVLGNGGLFRFYTGPGVTAGWVMDTGRSFGLMLGLMADVGIEYSSANVPVSIGCKVEPALALHAYGRPDELSVGSWMNGITKRMLPEITITYDFGKGSDGSSHGEAGNIASQSAKQRGDGFRRLTYGLETNYNLMLLQYRHYNYTDSDDVRHFDNWSYLVVQNNISLLAHVGLNATKHLNLAICSGYASFSSGIESIPVLLRGSWYFGKDPLRSRWFTFADAGPAFSFGGMLYGPAVLADLGGGYSSSLDSAIHLDLRAGLTAYTCSPKIEDSVRTTVSRENGLGLSLSANIWF